MPVSRTFTVRVDDRGLLPVATERHIRDHLQLYAGRKVAVRLSSPPRSHKANAYLWGVVYRAIRKGASEAGVDYAAKTWHEYFKDKYLDPTVEEVIGRQVVRPPSSAQLDSTAFYYFVESIRTDEMVRQFGVHVPDPDPGWKFKAGTLGEL